MKNSTACWSMALTVIGIGNDVALASERVQIRVVVHKQIAVKIPSSPFEDVGGFLFRQGAGEFKAGSCPNASDAKGLLTCVVTCEAADKQLRLYLQAPQRDRAPAVAGFTPPAEIPLEIKGCKVTTALPLMALYKTPSVLLGELMVSAPDVINALASPSWTPKSQKFEVKAFDDVAPKLKELSAIPGNRRAMVELSRMFSARPENLDWVAVLDSGSAAKPSVDQLEQYVVGTKSAILYGATSQLYGMDYTKFMPVTGKVSDYNSTTAKLRKTLATKAYLSADEAMLLNGMAVIQREDSTKLDAWGTWRETAGIEKTAVQPPKVKF